MTKRCSSTTSILRRWPASKSNKVPRCALACIKERERESESKTIHHSDGKAYMKNIFVTSIMSIDMSNGPFPHLWSANVLIINQLRGETASAGLFFYRVCPTLARLVLGLRVRVYISSERAAVCILEKWERALADWIHKQQAFTRGRKLTTRLPAPQTWTVCVCVYIHVWHTEIIFVAKIHVSVCCYCLE